MRRLIWCVLLCTVILSPAVAEETVWTLVFQDDFERAELGTDWTCPAGPRIVNGRFHVTSQGPVSVQINRSLKPDVKLEFVAEADPARPPCDISVQLASGHIMLQFGGGNNTFNAIHGGGADARDRKPTLLIEPGRKYRMTAVKEGPRLAYYADGKLLVEAETSDPLGGEGFDRVSLLTWNGMYVDEVRLYERATPASGGPAVLDRMPSTGFAWQDRRLTYAGPAGLSEEVSKGVALYNDRKHTEAYALLSAISPPTMQSVTALAYVVGDLAFDEKPDDQTKLADLADAVASQPPQSLEARDFALAARWFSGINIRRRNHVACQRLLKMGPEHNPFYYKAGLFETRFNYAHAIEGARKEGMQKAIQSFAELKKTWPEHRALREWTGEQIPWGEELIHPESDGPPWARHLHEAFARQQAILKWWFTQRQAPDGSLGGGWGDDVEILRGWVPIACITTAGEEVIAGIERLAQGVWDHVLEDGYDRGVGDVEHSAEPSCDSLPTMIPLRYGDPKWIEQNLRSAKTIRERFMGINERGHLHFFSTEFGVEGVRRQPQHGGDTGYHARAMKHFIWLAWYGIPEARETFLQWCEGWRDVTMSEIGTKPAGFVPASVWFPSGSIAPPTGEPWYDSRMNYYDFPGLPGMIHDSFITAYAFDPDLKWLDPINTMMDMATIGPLRKPDPALPPDHIDNLRAVVAHQSNANVTAAYRRLTGQRVYDEYTRRFGTPTQVYMMDYDLDAYAASFEKTAKGLRHNWTLRTSEVLQTDRAGLAGSQEVFGAYTGAVQDFRDSRAPTLAVTYDTPDLNFAAVVTETTPERLRVRLYSFNEQSTRIGLRPWRLVPGVYVLNTGEPVAGERPFQNRYTWTTPVEVSHTRAGTPIWVDVPPRKEWVVDLRLRKAIDRPKNLPDLAVTPRDLRYADDQLSVHVHNIGGDRTGAFQIALQAESNGRWQEFQRMTVEGLSAIEQFSPVVRKLVFPIDDDTLDMMDRCRVVIDPDGEVEELYELNNSAVLSR